MHRPLDPTNPNPYYPDMNNEINQLAVKISQLTEFIRRLSAQNNHLKGQLVETQRLYDQSQQKLNEARQRVESALSRLPVVSDN